MPVITKTFVFALCVWTVQAVFGAQEGFIRGDANHDGKVNISDAICGLSTIITGESAQCNTPSCLDALDTNDDGVLNLTDIVLTLQFLFEAGSALPPPTGLCGQDPTPDDGLTCLASRHCGGSSVLEFEVVSGLSFYSLWSESYDTVEEQYDVLSIIDFKPGTYQVSLVGGTENISLIDTVRFGPQLLTTTPMEPGKFFFYQDSQFPLEYQQTFTTEEGLLTVKLLLGSEDVPTTLDCKLVEGQPQFYGKAWLRAELDEPNRQSSVFYSCFYPERWYPSRVKSVTAQFEDNSIIVHLEQCPMCNFGVTGHTWNYRITRAQVNYEGNSFEVNSHDKLVYAALHHNNKPQLRVIFDTAYQGIRGIDILTCPCESLPGFRCPCAPKAYYLDASLERGRDAEATLIWDP